MNKSRLLNISYLALLAVLCALCRFDLPSAIELPFTLQCVAAVIAGLTLGSRDGTISMVIYLGLGLLGLPVFAYGGGYLYVLRPTFGYVLSLCVGAYVAGKLKQKFTTLSVTKLFFCAFFGLIAIYAIGIIYQIIIVCIVLEGSLAFAVSTLSPLIITFIIHATLLYFFCMIYPKALTMIGNNSNDPDKLYT